MGLSRFERPADGTALAQGLVLLPLGGLIAWWGLADGGYDPVQWQPGALALLPLAALVACTPALRRRRQPTRRLQVALGAFALYTAWSYASIAWAGDPGTALEGAHRCALYLVAMIVVGASVPDPRVLRGAGLVVAGLIGLAAVVTLARISGADGPAGLLQDGRLYAPLGYFNANAAFWTTGALFGCVAASQRETPAVFRVALLGFAVLEVGLAIMAASRGWLFTLPLVLLLVLVLTPGRVRLAVATLVVALAVFPALDAVLGPVRAGGGQTLETGGTDTIRAARDAVRPLMLAGLGAFTAGIAGVLADRRLVLSAGARRVVRRTTAILAVAATAGAALAVISVAPQPGDRLERAWEEFKANDTSKLSGASRFSSTGSSRYDFWRVATDLTGKHPLLGIGQDNFAQPYVARRAIDYEEPRWVHSLPLRALTHTGIVGAILLAVALGALAAGGIRIRERPSDRGAAALALAPLVVWTVHGSVDWLWEYPVLSVIALGLAAGAGNAQVVRRPEDLPAATRGRWAARAGAATVIALGVVGVVA
ncbi:MAG: O-antigen ligase family protein, partial [Solirubrobacteraceae bacterium]